MKELFAAYHLTFFTSRWDICNYFDKRVNHLTGHLTIRLNLAYICDFPWCKNVNIFINCFPNFLNWSSVKQTYCKRWKRRRECLLNFKFLPGYLLVLGAYLIFWKLINIIIFCILLIFFVWYSKYILLNNNK